jgi:hypothetical protein
MKAAKRTAKISPKSEQLGPKASNNVNMQCQFVSQPVLLAKMNHSDETSKFASNTTEVSLASLNKSS